jgi:hypothetical protein
MHRRLSTAASEWSARMPNVRDEFLYRGAALAEVEEWLARLPGDERLNLLSSNEVAFLEQSQAARGLAGLEKERWIRRLLVVALVIATLLAALAGFLPPRR